MTLDGDRKAVTAMFADIKGSTELEQDLDPEEARAIIDPALKLMIDAVRRYDGYIVQSTGDGIFALLGAPVAHEDHPQRALYEALRLQEELERYSAKLRAAGNLPIEGRVGVNTGELVVRSIATGAGQTEYTPIGHTTNLASRMQVVAPTGSIPISEQTRKLVEGYFQLKPLGPTKVKGVSEPVNGFEVTSIGPLRTRLQRAVGRGLTKFVGREREMEALKHAAEQAKSGHGQIVAAIAEPGVGKSRLLYEFKAKNQPEWMVLETLTVPHEKASAYLPLINLLHSYFDIEPEDDASKQREKVAARITILDRALEDALPYLFGLLGIIDSDDPLAQMDARVRKRRTLDAIKRILVRESLDQPLIAIFEDLQWIDGETQTFLNLLVDSIGTAKILLLVSYRPEYSHQLYSKTYYTQVRLDPLGRESASEMLDGLLGVNAQTTDLSLAALKRLIIEKTEGTPLFIEEIYQALIEEGALMHNGTVKLARSLDALKIPATVQAILASRIDRLPSAEKELLQTLAVIGMEFQVALARAVTGYSDDDLDRLLEVLQIGEFIYERPAVGDVEYTFKHALTQEVAYNSELKERRKLIHERIAQSIEKLYPGSLDNHTVELAHRYRRGGNSAKAIDYLLIAAERALDRNVPREAVAALNDGLALLAGIADKREHARREAALQLALCDALSFGRLAAPGTEEGYLRARQLCDQTGDRRGVYAALRHLRMICNLHAEYDKALEMSEEMLKTADNAELDQQFGAHVSAAETLYNLGEFSAARRYLEEVRGIAASDTRLGGVVRRGLSFTEPRCRAALILGVLGYPDQAVREDCTALAYVRETGNPFAVTGPGFSSAQLHHFLREVAKVRQHSEPVLRWANELGDSHLSGYTAAFLGWVEAMEGDAAEGIREIGRAIEVMDIAGGKVRPLRMRC